MKVTFLTVGEYPTLTSLHISQVLGFADYLKKYGGDVSWIAFFPPENRLVDRLRCKNQLENIRQTALEKGITLIHQSFPLSITYLYTYLFRDLLIYRAGALLTKLIKKKKIIKTNDLHIIHCRSYFAAAVALEAKKNLNVKVSFDMRSMLPPEVPLYFPKIGSMLYGGLKEWESKILSAVDISFLQCKRGIKLLELEGIAHLPLYQPIAGFEKKYATALLDLSERINQPHFGYLGGFGPWHSTNLLSRVFVSLKNGMPNAKFEVLTSTPIDLGSDITVKSAPNDAVPNLLSRYLALVVPGTQHSEGFFSRLQSSSNLFSTKASEALSIGLPIIVNELNTELAKFVRNQKCGLVFRASGSEIEYEGTNINDLRNPALWKDLSIAAQKCASLFQRENVFNGYIEAWNQHFVSK